MNSMDGILIEQLLHEEESETLDFKRDQYPFKNATPDQKGELLKDVLAFANAWKRSDAYILIGVDDVKGGRSNVVGVTHKLDDASLQQFVNQKTQKPILFSYRDCVFEGKDIAIIHVPCQERPFYLKKDFGKLKRNEVYLRRGSSTAIASLDEIAKIGAYNVTSICAPLLELFFFIPSSRERMNFPLRIKSQLLHGPEVSSIADYVTQSSGLFGMSSVVGPRANPDYYREVAKYTEIDRLVSPLFLAVFNSGDATAHGVHASISLSRHDSVVLFEESEFPSEPESSYSLLHPIPQNALVVGHSSKSNEIIVDSTDSRWLIEVSVGKVQAKQTRYLSEAFYIGSTLSQDIECDVTIYADNLTQPVTQKFQIVFNTLEQKVSLDDIMDMEYARLRSLEKYKHLFESEESSGNSSEQ